MPRRLVLNDDQTMLLALETVVGGLLAELQLDPTTSQHLRERMTELSHALDTARQTWLDQVHAAGLEQRERMGD